MTHTALTPAAAAFATYLRLVADPQRVAALASAADAHPSADLSARLAEVLHAPDGSVGLDELTVAGARLLTDPATWLGDAPALVFDLVTMEQGGGAPVRPAGQVRLTRGAAPDDSSAGRCEYRAADGTVTALRLAAGRLVAAAANDPRGSPLSLYLGFVRGHGQDDTPVLVGTLGDQPALGVPDDDALAAFSASDVADNFLHYWWAWLTGVLGFIGVVGTIVAIVRWRGGPNEPRDANLIREHVDHFDQPAQEPPTSTRDRIEEVKNAHLGEVTDRVNLALKVLGRPELTPPQHQALKDDFEQAIGLPEGDAWAHWALTWQTLKQEPFIDAQVQKLTGSAAQIPSTRQADRPTEPSRAVPNQPSGKPESSQTGPISSKRVDNSLVDALNVVYSNLGRRIAHGLKEKGWDDKAIVDKLSERFTKEHLIWKCRDALGLRNKTDVVNFDPVASKGKQDQFVQESINWLERGKQAQAWEQQRKQEREQWQKLLAGPDRKRVIEGKNKAMPIVLADAKATIHECLLKQGWDEQAIVALENNEDLQDALFSKVFNVLEWPVAADGEDWIDRWLAAKWTPEARQRLVDERIGFLPDRMRLDAQREQDAQLQQIADAMTALSVDAGLGVTQEDRKEYQALMEIQIQVQAIDPGDPQALARLRATAPQIQSVNAAIVSQSARDAALLDPTQAQQERQAENDFKQQQDEIARDQTAGRRIEDERRTLLD